MSPIEQVIVTAIITALVASVGTGFGIYMGLSNRLSVLETLMTDLRADVEKHNSVVERVYKLESDNNTLWKRMDEVRGDVADIKREHYGYVGNHRYEHNNGHGGGGNG